MSDEPIRADRHVSVASGNRNDLPLSFNQAGYLTPPGVLKFANPGRSDLPIFNELKYLRVEN